MSGPPTETHAGPPSYGDAVRELEGILAELEQDRVDIDVLADRVGRAAELIRFCRSRLDAARVEVSAIVDTLGPGGGDSGRGDQDGTEDESGEAREPVA